MDLLNLLGRTKNAMEFLHQDLSGGKGDISGFNSSVDRYAELVDGLQKDPHVDVHEYRYEHHLTPEPELKKLVRFQDDSNDEDALRAQLMGTSSTLKPYKDDPEEDAHSLLSVDTSNQGMFAENQQQMLAQDRNLDSLYDSVRTQRAMGLSINEELDDHLILLGDLEQGVDASSTRLSRASTRLQAYRRKVAENGSLVTIVVLTVILILLLVVLN